MRILQTFLTGGPISASATVANLVSSGKTAVLVGSDALYAWHATGGSLLTGFPVEGRNFFASRPLVTDLYGDGSANIIVGNDDDSLYGFDVFGKLLPGFPIKTGGDVYSSPAATDLTGDGLKEIVVGSDDGHVYVFRADGSILPGWPRKTGGFVSASSRIIDLDDDGQQEIIASSWDGRVYAWHWDGSLVSGWPQKTGHFLWSSPFIADITGDGKLEVLAASDKIYSWAADGSALPGWPQKTESYVVGTPVSANLFGGEPAVIAAADKLYAWNSEGEPLPEFPISFGTYFWSTPLVADSFQRSSLLLCGWNGCLYMIDSALEIEVIQLSTQPIFAKPTLADIDGSGREELLVGAWDSKLYVVEISQGYQNGQQLQSSLQPKLAGNLSSVLEATPPFISFSGQGTSQDTMYYRPIGEETWHPVPLINLNGRPTGLIQPYPSGTTVSFWADIGGQREPVDGFYKYSVAPDIAGRLQRRVRRWLAKW